MDHDDLGAVCATSASTSDELPQLVEPRARDLR
jgi:hypothetical protein